jgi:hypothetical protein
MMRGIAFLSEVMLVEMQLLCAPHLLLSSTFEKGAAQSTLLLAHLARHSSSLPFSSRHCTLLLAVSAAMLYRHYTH